MKPLLLIPVLCLPTLLLGESSLPSPTTEAPSRPVIDLSAPGADKLLEPSHASQVQVQPATDGKGIDVSVAAGPAGFPGVRIVPSTGAFDLSGAGFVEARVTNTGSAIISATLRMDSGENSASGSAYLKPGETGAARAYFASPGKGSNPLDAARITQILIFIGKNETTARAFRIDSLSAGGREGDTLPINPNTVRVKPQGGVIFSPSVPVSPGSQLTGRNGAKAEVTGNKTIGVNFSGKPEENVQLRPAKGYWDLGDFLQVTVKVKNTGSHPASLTAQLSSQADRSDTATPTKPIAPGETVDLVVPFIPGTPFKIISVPEQNQLEGKNSWGMESTPGVRYFSHQTNGLILSPVAGQEPSSFEVLAVTAGMPEGDPRPEWLGQRPPVEGEWIKTFEDNFDGTTLDESKWNVYSENHWDKRVGFSKQNVLIGDGQARLRIEKRAGFHNDDPNARATDFATGWLDTYDKWRQTYGYYEVRVKLPTAPSMFPAFWLMPQRGPATWPKYRQASTKDGGMEFDVFEGQSMWGPYRTTFGVHWDDYMKYHKSAGTSAHYNRPDKDGYLTIGMLWLPGHISVYSQGRLQGSWDSPRVGSVPSYLIFDMLPGGFEYDPLDPAKLPADLQIDYVRVWQRKDLMETGKN
ncbi:glycosyl hydrolases family 16 [Terrimicrobium sacchariphilum]|uniref:Glycosyl hydrolases family 16 n=1 Tax=Terrimicrobium sacchariphilum TaxID=690879 RepID=A0A146G207_TERSA|nr:glycoside hydrolase family 16 protein [Terrimicrobium sacchariphilum]GAT31865.1 glycosyl hydrolases family 16 [Terrimicrobium sacchariphilum]